MAREFTLRRTVVVLHGRGEEGRGEEIDYDPAQQALFQERGGELPLHGEHTLESFSLLSLRADRLPPLGVRVGGARSRAAPGRAVARGGDRPRAAAAALRRLDAHREACRAGSRSTRSCASSSTPTDDWTDEVIATLGRVETADFKGLYRGAFGCAARRRALRPGRARVPRRLARGSRADARDLGGARRRTATGSRGTPASTSGATSRRFRSGRGCSTASRRASARCGGSSTSTTRAPARGSGSTAAVSSSSGPGRGQIQLLASLFHPDAPNDVAPSGYNAAEPVAGLPVSPLEPAPGPGFR